MQRWIKDYAIVGAVALAVVGWFATRPSAPALQGSAPPVQLVQTDGQPFDLEAHKGQPVLLVFWAEWCSACRSQVPDINKLHAQRPDVAIIGLAVDSGSEAKIKARASQEGIAYPIAMADEDLARTYQVSALPTNIFIDAQGYVTDAVAGAMDFEDFNRRL